MKPFLKKLSSGIQIALIALAISVGVSYLFAQTPVDWSGPGYLTSGSPPPQDNVPAPINVGSIKQTKTGDVCTTAPAGGGPEICLSSVTGGGGSPLETARGTGNFVWTRDSGDTNWPASFPFVMDYGPSSAIVTTVDPHVTNATRGRYVKAECNTAGGWKLVDNDCNGPYNTQTPYGCEDRDIWFDTFGSKHHPDSSPFTLICARGGGGGGTFETASHTGSVSSCQGNTFFTVNYGDPAAATFSASLFGGSSRLLEGVCNSAAGWKLMSCSGLGSVHGQHDTDTINGCRGTRQIDCSLGSPGITVDILCGRVQ